MQYRKRRARAVRRSPIGIDLLRPPGHTLREQMDRALDEYQSHVLLLFLFPLILMAVLLARACLGHGAGDVGYALLRTRCHHQGRRPKRQGRSHGGIRRPVIGRSALHHGRAYRAS